MCLAASFESKSKYESEFPFQLPGAVPTSFGVVVRGTGASSMYFGFQSYVGLGLANCGVLVHLSQPCYVFNLQPATFGGIVFFITLFILVASVGLAARGIGKSGLG